jgi:hypothetical protein
MEHIQNNQKPKGKSITGYDLKNLKEKIQELKVLRLLPNVCDFQKENHTLGYGFKNVKKIYSLACGFYSLCLICKFRVETYQKSGHI